MESRKRIHARRACEDFRCLSGFRVTMGNRYAVNSVLSPFGSEGNPKERRRQEARQDSESEEVKTFSIHPKGESTWREKGCINAVTYGG